MEYAEELFGEDNLIADWPTLTGDLFCDNVLSVLNDV
jgi:hypothetical protein